MRPAFYTEEDGRFIASELTRGPWDPRSQHAGPPAALLGRAIELHDGIGVRPADRHVGRITFEIVRPVPIGPLRVEVTTERPGRRVEMLAARLLGADGEELVLARAWRLLLSEPPVPKELSSTAPGSPARRAGRPGGARGTPAPPERLDPDEVFFPGAAELGYHNAMEYRFERGRFVEPGPAVCWLRMGPTLVAGEEPTPLQRVLVAADTGNGISATVDFERFLFINVDLTVHLHRLPAGEWVCLDALTIPEGTGVGLTDTLLFDERGPIGRAAQTLLIAER